MNADKIDKRIEYHLSEIDRLEQKKMLAQRFGSDEDYPEETVIFWKRNFRRMPSAHERGCAIYSDWDFCDCRERTNVQRSRKDAYTYVAVKIDGMWWITGKTIAGMRWAQLVEQHLIRAEEETGEVWFASKWVHL